MDDRVYRYIRAVRDTCNHPLNLAIVVVETDDFVPTLTPEQLERAIIEVEVMGWSMDWPDFEGRQRILDNLFALHDRIDNLAEGLDPEAVAASLEQAELAAVAAADAAETSASSAQAAYQAAAQAADAATTAAADGTVAADAAQVAASAATRRRSGQP